MSAAYIPAIISALEGEKFESVIEIGCGEKQNLRAIKERFPEVEVHGCDKNGARDYPAMEIPFCDITKDMTGLYGPKSYDVVLVAATLLLIGDEDMEQVIKNITHVAKKMIILMEPHKEGHDVPNIGTSERARFLRDYTKYFPGKKIVISDVSGWSSPNLIGKVLKIYV